MQRSGDVKAAADIYEKLVEVNPSNATVLHYLGLARMQLGDLQGAEGLISRSLLLASTDPNTCSDLGMVKAKASKYEEAITLFKRALTIDEHHSDALRNIAATLNTLKRPREALPYLERLCDLQPDSSDAVSRLAHTFLRVSDVDRAITYFRKAVKLEPNRTRARILLGEALEAAGQFKQAQFQYLSVLRREENNIVALAKLLNLRDISHEWAERALNLLERRNLEEAARIRLHVALGHYYDRTGSFDEAFRNFQVGYELQRKNARFNSKHFSAAVDRLINTFTSAFFSRVPSQTIRSARPIFIVGMPRSGTTLVEQILASHSQVAAGGELSTIMNVGSQIHHLGRNYRPYPDGIRDLTSLDLARMAQRYLDRLDLVSTHAARVTDKLPFNYMHLGLIAILFPEAKIIHCRREPMDNCLSCYFTSFSEELQFANNLQTLGNYYLDYCRLMEHWHRVLPVKVLDVQYENLVGSTHEIIREILAYCSLDWEDTCLSFYGTKRGVRTPSRWQVRQPIYTSSVGRWKNYESHLDPLKKIFSRQVSPAG